MEAGTLVTLYELENGMIRLVSENDMMNHYKMFRVYVRGKKIKKIVNGSDFPVQPLKLVMKGGAVRSKASRSPRCPRRSRSTRRCSNASNSSKRPSASSSNCRRAAVRSSTWS